jgi:hypothetical protein
MDDELLQIKSFSDAARKSSLGTFECYVSPTAFKMHHCNLYGNLHPINSSIPLSAFATGGKSTIEVSIILDGTAAVAVNNDEPIPVVTQLKDLMVNTVLYDGTIHQPRFLEVIWGDLPVFSCRAETLDVEYKTFNKAGVPVRADVQLLFIEDLDADFSRRQTNKQSPDLFHRHEVVDNETLASISYKYYDDTKHLDLIARTNSLNNLYDCVSGTSLLIPPLGLPGENLESTRDL